MTADAPGDPVPLGSTRWRLVELGGVAVDAPPDGTEPHLVFDLEESRVAGSGGVNRVMGAFALAEDELEFGPLATTLMAGPEDAMRRERDFLDALARVTSYELDGASLTLVAGDEPILRLAC
jgi:copper homeostasis protein (lipoprotein)